ncbi:MAG: HDIG domain-containing protein [Deltaproteobacteria bacterium]|nr:HDIG domain-containing protein [Deltaproteobacteria bacterium]
MSITRDEAVALLEQYIKNEKMRDHCYATEAVMRALARRLGRDEDKWGIAGLLHDLDAELVNADLNVHGLETARILEEKGIDPDMIDAIKMHNEQASGAPRSLEFHHALAAGETVTGLIIATTLVYPDKKLSGVKTKSVTKRMKEKAFAASVNREIIRECEKIGLPLDEFVTICLEAMRGISNTLKL